MAELRPPNRVPRRIRQEAASNGCAGISGTGKRRPPSTMGAIDRRRRAAGFYSGRCAQPRGFLSVLLDEFSSYSRFDCWLTWPFDVAASHRRRLGHYHPPSAGIGLSRPSADGHCFLAHCVIRNALSLFGPRRRKGLAQRAANRRRRSLEFPKNLPYAKWLLHPGSYLLRRLAGADVHLQYFVEATGRQPRSPPFLPPLQHRPLTS